jgi:hypothetical protein
MFVLLGNYAAECVIGLRVSGRIVSNLWLVVLARNKLRLHRMSQTAVHQNGDGRVIHDYNLWFSEY